AAAAGHIVVPGSPGIGSAGSSPLAGALSNLTTAMTTTGPTVLPGMSSAQMWQFFVSCFEAKGYLVMQMPEYTSMKAEYQASHPDMKLRGVAKTFDFQ